MKIYTKTGDAGTTGLIGGTRVSKGDARLEAYGTVDELNAALGLAVVALDDDLKSSVEQVQGDLFVIGSHLATPGKAAGKFNLPALPDPAQLEAGIDAADGELEPLTSFILPGGCESAARLHLARCICRRAERDCVIFAEHLSGENAEDLAAVIVWLNRLSDWLFTMARLANHRAGKSETPWSGGS